MKSLFLLGALFSGLAFAQNPGNAIISTTQDPTGQTCNSDRINEKTPDGKIYTCQNGVMAQIGSAGGGTPTGPCGGDLGGTYPNCSVLKVNGQPYGSSPAAHQVPITGVYKSITDCPAGGLGFTQSTDAFGCNSIPAAQLHSVTFVINGASGGAITTGALGVFPAVDFACTINRIDVSGTPSGSITVDIWKAAGAIPTSGNKISASAPATLSSSQLSQNGSLSGWTLGVSAGDVFGGTIATAATVTAVTITIWCQ